VGDVVLAIDDVSVDGMDLSEAVSMIRSKEESFVLQVYRESEDKELALALSCSEVELDYVQWEMMTDEIGYLKLTEFTTRGAEQFREALEEMEQQGMTRLIVDLRDNPGGLLDAVCDMLDMILPDDLLVYTEDRNGSREEYYGTKSRVFDGQVAVLVNGNSASASEIFAGAVQDWALGPVVGTQSYGKGVVQKTFTLSDGSAFKLTVEKYYTPNGQDIDGNGITPDIEVTESDDTDSESENTESEGAESEDGDPVLERALEALAG
jgi:carboxyl-terminal processing protease